MLTIFNILIVCNIQIYFNDYCLNIIIFNILTVCNILIYFNGYDLNIIIFNMLTMFQLQCLKHSYCILISMIWPLKYVGDYRPYFTIHDNEFKEYTTRTQSP